LDSSFQDITILGENANDSMKLEPINPF